MRPSDPLFDRQWHFGLIGDIRKVWKDYDGTGVTVGIYDTGVESRHRDLAGQVDPDLRARDDLGNALNGEPDPNWADNNGHGQGAQLRRKKRGERLPGPGQSRPAANPDGRLQPRQQQQATPKTSGRGQGYCGPVSTRFNPDFWRDGGKPFARWGAKIHTRQRRCGRFALRPKHY